MAEIKLTTAQAQLMAELLLPINGHTRLMDKTQYGINNGRYRKVTIDGVLKSGVVELVETTYRDTWVRLTDAGRTYAITHGLLPTPATASDASSEPVTESASVPATPKFAVGDKVRRIDGKMKAIGTVVTTNAFSSAVQFGKAHYPKRFFNTLLELVEAASDTAPAPTVSATAAEGDEAAFTCPDCGSYYVQDTGELCGDCVSVLRQELVEALLMSARLRTAIDSARREFGVCTTAWQERVYAILGEAFRTDTK